MLAQASPSAKSGSCRSRATSLVQRRLERRCWVVRSGTWPRPWRLRMRLTVCRACFGELFCSLRCASHTTRGARSPQAAMASRGRGVRQVPVRPADAPLEEGRVRAGLEQVRVVVGFENQQVEIAELARDGVWHPPEIGSDRGAGRCRLRSESRAARGSRAARRTALRQAAPSGYVLPDSTGRASARSLRFSAPSVPRDA